MENTDEDTTDESEDWVTRAIAVQEKSDLPIIAPSDYTSDRTRQEYEWLSLPAGTPTVEIALDWDERDVLQEFVGQGWQVAPKPDKRRTVGWDDTTWLLVPPAVEVTLKVPYEVTQKHKRSRSLELPDPNPPAKGEPVISGATIDLTHDDLPYLYDTTFRHATFEIGGDHPNRSAEREAYAEKSANEQYQSLTGRQMFINHFCIDRGDGHLRATPLDAPPDKPANARRFRFGPQEGTLPTDQAEETRALAASEALKFPGMTVVQWSRNMDGLAGMDEVPAWVDVKYDPEEDKRYREQEGHPMPEADRLFARFDPDIDVFESSA